MNENIQNVKMITLQRSSFVSSSKQPQQLEILQVGDRKTSPPSIELRDYQRDIVAQTYHLIRTGTKRILVIVVMGAGKTITAAWMLRDAVRRGKRCVFLVGLNVLLEQTKATLLSLGVDCTILQGDRVVDCNAPVIIASQQTIASRLRRGKSLQEILGRVDVFVADEAHVTAFHQSYDLERNYSSSIFIGLSATPWRVSKREWLGQKFDASVIGPQPPEIIKRGSAVPDRGFTLTGVFDLETLRVRRGEYVDADLASQASRDEALEHIVSEWKRLCIGRPTLMVGAGIEQARLTCDRFNQHEITAELIIGSTSKQERLAIFERVKAGQTQVICSVGCLTAGFDLPCISAVLYVRATKSKALFFQTAGRGSRPAPGKSDYLLLDFGGNLKRHGSPMSWQNYDISQPIQEEAIAPTKTCPGCGAEITIFAQNCPECDYEFSGERNEEEEVEALVLQNLNEFVDPFVKEKIKNIRQWRKQAFESDRTPDEPIDRFFKTYGHHPPNEWLLNCILTRRHSPKRKAEFIEYLRRHCKTESRWARNWIAHHLCIEFGDSGFEQLDLGSYEMSEVMEVSQ